MSKVWVVGGTSGIGAAVAEQLAEAVGITTLATGHEDVDVRSRRAMLSHQYSNGPFSGIVYCAGINHLSWLSEYDEDAWDDIFAVNVKGFYTLCNMLAHQGDPCRVVVVSSDADHRPMRTSMAYCASKAALTMAARVAARELGPAGHRVNVVRPGMTADTEMTRQLDEEIPALRSWSRQAMLDYELSQQVLKRRAYPEEIAKVIVSTLLGPDYLNGAVIDVNGGR